MNRQQILLPVWVGEKEWRKQLAEKLRDYLTCFQHHHSHWPHRQEGNPSVPKKVNAAKTLIMNKNLELKENLFKTKQTRVKVMRLKCILGLRRENMTNVSGLFFKTPDFLDRKAQQVSSSWASKRLLMWHHTENAEERRQLAPKLWRSREGG